jgi:hypothetical protein
MDSRPQLDPAGDDEVMQAERHISLQWGLGVISAVGGLVLGIAGTAWTGASDWTRIQARVGVLETQNAEIRSDMKLATAQAAAMAATLAVISSRVDDIRTAVLMPGRQGSVSDPPPVRR